MWMATWEKNLTLDQLMKRGRILFNRCCLYNEDQGSAAQALLQVNYWPMCYSVLYFQHGLGVPPSVKNILSWHSSFVGTKHKAVWGLILLCIFWAT